MIYFFSCEGCFNLFVGCSEKNSTAFIDKAKEETADSMIPLIVWTLAESEKSVKLV
jgi:hypothetical protein